MENYFITNKLGSGTFGCVWRAVNKHSGEVVAIKALKESYSSWQECLNLREVKCLRKLNHSNIVKLKELIKNNNVLYFVFEFMEGNLHQLMAARKQKLFSEAEVKTWLFQIFRGLNYMHQQGYFHRDLKPENLLVSKTTIKIADFGLAREINSPPPFTGNVGTRWYQAPEMLFHSRLYSSKVDMWAMGAIMAELFTLRPLFPGTTEVDQMDKICRVLGSPTMNSWADGLRQARAINYQFPQLSGVDLSLLMPSASKDAISLIGSLCSWDPCKRPTAAEALQHPFFQRCSYVPPHIRSRSGLASATIQSAAATRGARMCVEASSNSKIIGKLSPLDLIIAVQQKSVKEPKCHPEAGKKNPATINKGKIACNWQCVAQLKLPHMMTGTGAQWNAESGDLFIRPIQNLEPGRI